MVVATGLAVMSGTARADHAGRHSQFVDGGVTLRVAMQDPSNRDDYHALSDYGYDTGRVGIGLRLSGGFRVAPRLDLGIGGEYLYRGDGSPRDKTIRMRSHVRQLGVFARPHLSGARGRVDLAGRLEIGAMQSITILRQQELETVSPYVRARIELVAGGRHLGVVLHVGYLVVAGQDQFAPYPAPILGGISCGVGMFHRFR